MTGSETSEPRVSGVITTYDRPAFLVEAIESAFAQSRPLVELIVVDDCSPCDIASVIAQFGDRIRYLRQPRNQGPSAARNAGVVAAKGDLVAFLDDDDRWLPDKIERQVRALQSGYQGALCGWQFIGGRRPQVQSLNEITAERLRWGNPFCGTSGLIAARATLLAEPFDEALRWGEDWDLYVRLAQRAPVAYVAASLFERHYGEHEGLTEATRREPLEDLLRKAEAAKKHRAWLGDWGYRTALARTLLRQVSKRSDRHRQMVQSIRHAGLAATLVVLGLMYRRAMQRR